MNMNSTMGLKEGRATKAVRHCAKSRAYKERRACNSHSDGIDGEIISVTKNSNTKLGFLVYWGSILRI